MQNLLQLEEFLQNYPQMRLEPSRSAQIILSGTFAFRASFSCSSIIADKYKLKIVVPKSFPKDIPFVFETDNKIPRDGNHHVNPDSTLCLGSPLRLALLISENPTLVNFAEKCLIPYLYAISHKLDNGGDFIFGELAHGNEGIIADYMELFKCNTQEELFKILDILTKKRRVGNKIKCPCCSSIKISKCKHLDILNRFRNLRQPRSWWKKNLQLLKTSS